MLQNLTRNDGSEGQVVWKWGIEVVLHKSVLTLPDRHETMTARQEEMKKTKDVDNDPKSDDSDVNLQRGKRQGGGWGGGGRGCRRKMR